MWRFTGHLGMDKIIVRHLDGDWDSCRAFGCGGWMILTERLVV